MITLERFYKEAVNDNIIIDEFEFKKTKLNPVYREFILGLIYHIGKFLHMIHQFHKFKKIDRKFINHLNSLREFYSFLKNKSANFRNYLFDVRSFEESNKRVLNKETLKKYKDVYSKETSHTLFEVLPLTEHEETITFSNSLEESYCDCIKVLMTLIYINNSKCMNMTDDLLFEVSLSLFTHMVPHHFDDLDKDCLGLISQIDFLEKKYVDRVV